MRDGRSAVYSKKLLDSNRAKSIEFDLKPAIPIIIEWWIDNFFIAICCRRTTQSFVQTLQRFCANSSSSSLFSNTYAIIIFVIASFSISMYNFSFSRFSNSIQHVGEPRFAKIHKEKSSVKCYESDNVWHGSANRVFWSYSINVRHERKYDVLIEKKRTIPNFKTVRTLKAIVCCFVVYTTVHCRLFFSTKCDPQPIE